MLTSAGAWNIVIRHGLTTATVLTPFAVVVETDRGVNECVNFCSSIPFSFGVVPGVSSTCNCESNFVWIAGNQTCGINCSQFANTTGVRVTGFSDQCVCSNPLFYWNTTQLTCIINCSLLARTNGSNGTDACYCSSDYVWDAITLQCVRDCNAIQYAVSFAAANVSECTCIANFVWDISSSKCVVNCSTISYANGSTSSIDVCTCDPKFLWNATTLSCEIDCLSLNRTDVTGLRFNGSVSECVCVDSSYGWEPALL